jgi:hypothetical protein
MFDFISIIPGKKKNTSSGWTTFNAVCCHNRGHRVDQKMRGGIKIENHTQVYHCFNCGFKCSFKLGSKISFGTRQLLTWCGIDESQIQRWNLLSLQQKDLLDFTPEYKHIKIKLEERTLPEGEILDANNTSHKKYVEYLQKRQIDVSSYPFLITPQLPGRYRDRIIVPYTYKNKIVGHTSRFLDGKTPKYINEQQPGYVFNIDIQKPSWQVCILTEGIFDALSIDGIAIMHETISNEQARVIRKLNKQIIVVPDRDETGLKICDRALELGYSVSLPNWDNSVKDVNDAVVKYGKALTLISILNSATNSKIKIEMQRKKIAKSIGI